MEAAKTVPADKIHVSKQNARYGFPFGETEEDKALIENMKKENIVQAFKVRKEGDGYGVFVGRRRFLAKKAIGTKLFIVGKDLLIDQVDDAQARLESAIELLDFFQKKADPWTRARSMQNIIDDNMGTVRGTAKKLGIPFQTLSEWTSILRLHGDWDRLIKEGRLGYMDAIKLMRFKLGELQEEELAETLDKEGLDAYCVKLAKLTGGKAERRGVPRGKYVIIRTTLEKRSTEDMKLLKGLETLAKAQNKEVNVYAKDVLTEHVKKALG